MKDAKTDNSSCHQEHVMILNSLTESLRDELKRGLGLMDTCVNQLAQAKWILINVEKTIEDAYATCPACDSSGRKKHDGHVPASPRTSVSTTNVMASPVNGTLREEETAKKVQKAARKVNVLPMISGHTIQKPNINIPRVEPKPPPPKKTKKTDTPTPSTSRNRSFGRGLGSGLLASATAAVKSGNAPKDSDDEVDKSSVKSSKSRSKQSEPELVAEEEIKQGGTAAVALSDIKDKLDGRMHIVGSELVLLMKSLGLPVDFKVKNKIQKQNDVDLTSDKSDSEDDRSVRSRKNESRKGRDGSTSKTEEAGKSSAPQHNLALLLQNQIKVVAKKTTTEELSSKLSAVAKDNDDSDTERSSKSPERKKGRYDSEAAVTSKSSKRRSRKVSSAAGSSKLRPDSDDSDDGTTSFSRRKPAGRKKKKISEDDSDFEVESTKKAKKSPRKASGKFISKEILSDSDDSSASKNNTKVKKNKTKDAVWSSDSDGSKKKSIAVKGKSESPPPPKAPSTLRAGPASQKAKRNGPRPGPLSRKQPVENENESDLDKTKNNDKPDSNVHNSPDPDDDAKEGTIQIAPNTTLFSDSDSEDSEIAKIKNRIPLNLQDAARSPSPNPIPGIGNTSSVFTRLLQVHNPSSSTWEKFRKRCTTVNSKVMELDEELQTKLSKAGKLLKPYDGTFSAADAPFESGRYYVVGEPGDERLVLYERNELQVLDMDDEELNDLAK